jgi:hypothetical protein
MTVPSSQRQQRAPGTPFTVRLVVQHFHNIHRIDCRFLLNHGTAATG